MDDDQYTIGPDLQGRYWTYSICWSAPGWDVDCWDEKDQCVWSRHFNDKEKAKVEFERWRK